VQVNIEHTMLGPVGNVIEGKENRNESEGSSTGSITRERVVEDKKAGELA